MPTEINISLSTDNENTNKSTTVTPYTTEELKVDLDLSEKVDDFETLESMGKSSTEFQSEHDSGSNVSSIYGPIPTIEITPAEEDDSEFTEKPTNTASSSFHPYEGPSNVNMDWLRPPVGDLTINISRPSHCEDNKNASKLVENSSCEDLDDMICRFSSTPVTSPDRTNRLSDSDVSMLSISKASPIVPENIPTPVKLEDIQLSEHQCCDDVGQVTIPDSGQQNCPNVVFPEAQITDKDAYTLSNPSHMNDNICEFGLTFDGHVHKTDAYPGTTASFYPGLQSSCEYPVGRDNSSWNDQGYFPPQTYASDPSCYTPNPSAGIGSFSGGEYATQPPEYFVYPSIYVSSAGLISVLLRNDISVEMTVDRTIRVVSHNNMMAVGVDSRGTEATLYHPAIKVVQTGSTTDIATNEFHAQMSANDVIVFTNGVNYFRLDGVELQPVTPMKLPDIQRDQSVNLLFSSEGYGQQLIASCMQVAAQAEYATLPKGGIMIRINGVKVTQTGGGDVTVVTGAKFIRLSPTSGSTRLGNRFIDVEVERDWSVKLTRGSHSFKYDRKTSVICNGKMEAGFDENSALKVTNLAPRHPLLAVPTIVRRNYNTYNNNNKHMRSGPGYTPLSGNNYPQFTPRRRHGPPFSGFNNRPGGGPGMGAF